EVTRRITRAGDAGYRLNGANCRLLDVHEALALRGLGPEALAVIRQGQVEAVCASRPGDIRAILEEAAGVALSRRRRRRAESRLEKVAERLDRARDLQGELEDRRASLQRQAQAAERAVELDRALEVAHDHARRAAAHTASRALDAARAAHAAAGAVRAERDADA
ncbi:MAG: chromosome segregation protein, partial [Thermoleophilia bacterium]|nr:chromosome segregation protein [Thermoleophilia bacterium]